MKASNTPVETEKRLKEGDNAPEEEASMLPSFHPVPVLHMDNSHCTAARALPFLPGTI